jgi:HTH-type transcriptional regulator, sugar sensing transcriptional regulator
MLAFIRPPYAYATSEQQQDQVNAQMDALKRGVKIRLIHDIPADAAQKTAFFKSILRYTAPKGYEPRIIEKLPMKLAIYDEKIVLISLEDPIQGKPSITSLLAEHHALAKGLKEMFESYWKKARGYFILNNRKYLIANPLKKQRIRVL